MKEYYKINDIAVKEFAELYKLKVLLTIKGSEKLEKEIHSKFAEFRLSGEWFKPVK